MKRLIAFLFIVSIGYPLFSQRIYINRLDKMDLFGISKEKIGNFPLNLYSCNSDQGRGGSSTYLDNNKIELILDEKGTVYIIYDIGYKKELTRTRNYYYTLKLDNLIKHADVIDLFEEDKINLSAPELLTINYKRWVDHSVIYTLESILCIDPPLLLNIYYYEIPRVSINDVKYGLEIEVAITESVMDLYKLLSDEMKTKSLNKAILKLLEDDCNSKILEIPALSPKGEFETSADYQVRINGGKVKKDEIEQRYHSILSEIEPLFESELKAKVEKSLEKITLKIEAIGLYNADNQTFPITINRITKNITIPIDQAAVFKNKKDEIMVTAISQLNMESEELEISNVKIINPVTGEEIIFSD